MESEQQLVDRYREYADSIAELVKSGEISVNELDIADQGYLGLFHPELVVGVQNA